AYGHALGQGIDVNGNIVWAVRLILDALDDWHHRGDTNDGLVAVASGPNGDRANLVPEHLRDLEDSVDEGHRYSSSTSTSTAISTALSSSAVSPSRNITTSNSNVSH